MHAHCKGQVVFLFSFFAFIWSLSLEQKKTSFSSLSYLFSCMFSYFTLYLPFLLHSPSSPSIHPWQLCVVQVLFDLQSRTHKRYPLATTRTSPQELDRALTDTLYLCCCCLAPKAHCLLLLMLLILCASPQLKVGITDSAHLTQAQSWIHLLNLKC